MVSKNLYLSKRYLVDDTKISAKDILDQIKIELEAGNLKKAITGIDILKAYLKGF